MSCGALDVLGGARLNEESVWARLHIAGSFSSSVSPAGRASLASETGTCVGDEPGDVPAPDPQGHTEAGPATLLHAPDICIAADSE
jgi:hypothetical protein